MEDLKNSPWNKSTGVGLNACRERGEDKGSKGNENFLGEAHPPKKKQARWKRSE